MFLFAVILILSVIVYMLRSPSEAAQTAGPNIVPEYNYYIWLDGNVMNAKSSSGKIMKTELHYLGLPIKELDELRHGISASSYDEFLMFMEDYTS